MMQSQVRAGTVTAEEWLDQCEPGLKKTTLAMFRACKEIAYKIRTASCDKMACFNEFGDEQLAIDLLANTVIFENLKEAGSVATASSEETPTEDPIGGSGYSVAFDPLDGIHFNSIHFTSLHFTSTRFTSLHFTSLHFIHFTSLHFITFHLF